MYLIAGHMISSGKFDTLHTKSLTLADHSENIHQLLFWQKVLPTNYSEKLDLGLYFTVRLVSPEHFFLYSD